MNYASIRKTDISNGEGVRCSLFVSGCNFHCPNCFNQEAQDFNYGKPFTIETYQQIVEILKKPQIDGLSILGGDPLWQSESDIYTLCSLCDEVHSNKKTIWLWSGFKFEEIMNGISIARKDLLKSCDVFVDGRYVDKLRDLSLAWRGSSNQRVIDVPKSLSKGSVVIYD